MDGWSGDTATGLFSDPASSGTRIRRLDAINLGEKLAKTPAKVVNQLRSVHLKGVTF